MQLLERQSQLDELASRLQEAEAGSGKVVFLAGEAGAGKSSLVETFTTGPRRARRVVWGCCDALQTPRALGPVHEIAVALKVTSADTGQAHSRENLFANLVNELAQPARASIVVLEDLHWADEATLDFVRFLGRRIQRTHCLLIATYRDDELPAAHPLRRTLGEVTGHHVSRIRAPALSQQAVEHLAREAHREDRGIYAVTSGNPFFVREVLAAPPGALPETVRDAVIARLMQCSAPARELAGLVSLSPHRTELWLAESLLGALGSTIEEGVTRGLLRVGDGSIAFRHELARLAVESTVSQSRAREVHQRLLAALTQRGADLSQLVHHAGLAGDTRAVLEFAPRAARQAASLGSHREAAAHFAAALRHAAQLPTADRAALFEGHAWECNLTNQVKAGIESSSCAHSLYCELGDEVAQARVLRVLSRLYWQLGDNAEASRHAAEAVATLESLPPSRDLAMAYSTRSMLAMLAGRVEEALEYGHRALGLGREFEDIESQVHSLNNIGSTLLGSGDASGFSPVEQALSLALEHGLHEAAGRAYTNLMTCSVLRLDLARAERVMREGLAFCEEREIYTHMYYLRAYGSRLEFLRGRWAAAAALATELLEGGAITPIQRIPTLLTLGLIRARRGDPGAEPILDEAMRLASPTLELQRIGRVAAARAEVAWYRGDLEQVEREVDIGLKLAEGHREPWIRGELAYWQSRARPERETPKDISEPYRLMIDGEWRRAGEAWKTFGMPYEAALAFAGGPEEGLRESLEILETLGAGPLATIVRHRLREQGVRGIPRGPRASTRGNPAGLTSREVEVLKLLVQGHTNVQVARRLHLSAKTIDHHVSSILEKLEVRSRTEAVAAAFGLGIVKSS